MLENFIQRAGAVYEHRARWNKLRRLGTSPAVRVTIIAPIVASVLLFTSQFMSLFSTWRLLAFFWGSILAGAASLIYSIWCPGQCQKYDTAVEFALTEADFFTANQSVLVAQITQKLRQNENAANTYLDRTRISGLLTLTKVENSIGRDDVLFLMDQLWHMLDPARRTARIACRALYDVGLLLLALPPLYSLWEISNRFLAEVSAALP